MRGQLASRAHIEYVHFSIGVSRQQQVVGEAVEVADSIGAQGGAPGNSGGSGVVSQEGAPVTATQNEGGGEPGHAVDVVLVGRQRRAGLYALQHNNRYTT
jgi:hypothetical protein